MKLYADESESEYVRNLDGVVASALAAVEVPAALWRKHRLNELTAEHSALLVQEFEADLYGTDDEEPRFAAVAVREELIAEAAVLVARHPLRAYDALQLASALAVRRALGELEGFACFDLALRNAAAAEGFVLVPER